MNDDRPQLLTAYNCPVRGTAMVTSRDEEVSQLVPIVPPSRCNHVKSLCRECLETWYRLFVVETALTFRMLEKGLYEGGDWVLERDANGRRNGKPVTVWKVYPAGLTHLSERLLVQMRGYAVFDYLIQAKLYACRTPVPADE